jgi:hypothetical protein
VPAEGGLGLDPLLGRDETQLLEPRDVALREWLVAQIGQGRTAPEAEGLAESSRSNLGPTVRERGASFLEDPLETVEIELGGIDSKQVAPALAPNGVVASATSPAPSAGIGTGIEGRHGTRVCAWAETCSWPGHCRPPHSTELLVGSGTKRSHGQQEDLHVEPERPVLNVVVIPLDAVGE